MIHQSTIKGLCVLLSILLITNAPEIMSQEVQNELVIAEAQTYDYRQAPPPVPEPKTKVIPPLAKAYYDLGETLYYSNQYNEAIPYFIKALDLAPKWGIAHFMLAASYINITDYQKGIVSMKKALKDTSLSDIDRSEAYRTIGAVQTILKLYEDAEHNYRMAIKIDEFNIDAYNSLAYLYALQRINLDKALELINYAISNATDATEEDKYYWLDTRGWIYYIKGDLFKAEQDIIESLNIAKKLKLPKAELEKISLSDANYHLAMVYIAQNELEKAKKHLKIARDYNKNNSDVTRAMRELQMR